MSFFSAQNPGIGGLEELTNAEEIFLTTFAGLTYSDGDVLTIVSGQPAWEPSTGGLTKDVIGVTVDGGGSVVSTGSKGYKVIQEACTITGWTILGKEAGSVVIDIKKSTYAGFPTTSSIAGTEKPTLSSSQKNQDLALSTWTTSLAEGDILEFIIDSASALTRFNLFIHITK